MWQVWTGANTVARRPALPHCGVIDHASRIKGGRKGLLFCAVCRRQFTVTVGTVFERSKIPLNTWLFANHLLCSSKNGITSQQLVGMIGVTYKTAWFVSHRIRDAMTLTKAQQGTLGGAGKFVEADETYVGRKNDKRTCAVYIFMLIILRVGRPSGQKAGKRRSIGRPNVQQYRIS